MALRPWSGNPAQLARKIGLRTRLAFTVSMVMEAAHVGAHQLAASANSVAELLCLVA